MLLENVELLLQSINTRLESNWLESEVLLNWLGKPLPEALDQVLMRPKQLTDSLMSLMDRARGRSSSERLQDTQEKIMDTRLGSKTCLADG